MSLPSNSEARFLYEVETRAYGSLDQQRLKLVHDTAHRFDLARAITQIVGSQSVEDVWGQFTTTQSNFGFDRVLYISTSFNTFGALGDIADALVLSSYPSDFTEEFLTPENIPFTPIADSSSLGPRVSSWPRVGPEAKSGSISIGERRICELNKQWGISAGLFVELDEIWKRNRSVVFLAAKAGLTQHQIDQTWQLEGEKLLTYANLVNLKISSLPHTSVRRALTARQVEVLEWVADGKTGQDIATILKLSEATVEKHLRAAREALGVQTSAQAVQKAERLNLLFARAMSEPTGRS